MPNSVFSSSSNDIMVSASGTIGTSVAPRPLSRPVHVLPEPRAPGAAARLAARSQGFVAATAPARFQTHATDAEAGRAGRPGPAKNLAVLGADCYWALTRVA
jgi:hypothetical protein